MVIDPQQSRPSRTFTKLLIGAIVPRPIACVSTAQCGRHPKSGDVQLFHPQVSANRCDVVSTPWARGPVKRKDTFATSQRPKSRGCNIVSEEFEKRIGRDSADFPHEGDEFEASGLTAFVPSDLVKARARGRVARTHGVQAASIDPHRRLPLSASLVLGEVLPMSVDAPISMTSSLPGPAAADRKNGPAPITRNYRPVRDIRPKL